MSYHSFSTPSHHMTRNIHIRNSCLGVMLQSVMDFHLRKACPDNPSGLPPNSELTFSSSFSEQDCSMTLRIYQALISSFLKLKGSKFQVPEIVPARPKSPELSMPTLLPKNRSLKKEKRILRGNLLACHCTDHSYKLIVYFSFILFESLQGKYFYRKINLQH